MQFPLNSCTKLLRREANRPVLTQILHGELVEKHELHSLCPHARVCTLPGCLQLIQQSLGILSHIMQELLEYKHLLQRLCLQGSGFVGSELLQNSHFLSEPWQDPQW